MPERAGQSGGIDEGLKNIALVLLQIAIRVVVPALVVGVGLALILLRIVPSELGGIVQIIITVGIFLVAIAAAIAVGGRGWRSVEAWAAPADSGQA